MVMTTPTTMAMTMLAANPINMAFMGKSSNFAGANPILDPARPLVKQYPRPPLARALNFPMRVPNWS